MKLSRAALLLIPMLTWSGCGGVGSHRKELSSWDAGWNLTSDYSLREKLDGAELRKLAAKESRDHAENRRLMLLILHAAATGDASFADLPGKPGLRTAKNVDLALDGYDFAIHRNPAALDRILASLRKQPVGADADEIVVLSVLDEWDKSIPAFRQHFRRTDGAGGICRRSFETTRQYLYPDQYAAIRHQLEPANP
jgi:hypothetical protein